MLQVARLAPRLLGESADLVAGYLLSQLNADGGFADRAGKSDLYYTVFGLEGLLALQAPVPHARVRGYLDAFGDGADLDFVHLCCLLRCRADLAVGAGHAPPSVGTPTDVGSRATHASPLQRLESFRTPDGGYNAAPNSAHGTAYACFLALGAYQDAQLPLPDPAGLLRCLESLRADDGGYANQRDMPLGLTPATAAAVTLLRQFNAPIDPSLGRWLLDRQHDQGGFFAAPLAPIPDLLSTATALHALSGMHIGLDATRDLCLDFLDSLWDNSGGFCGSWTDDIRDAEYTYYALLALGHLAV